MEQGAGRTRRREGGRFHGKESGEMKGRWLLFAMLAAVLVLAGCGGGTEKPAGEPAPQKVVTVGSKEFTEQLILAKVTQLVLEDAGFKVNDKCGLGGTMICRNALLNGGIDVYWEYTGTCLLVQLKHEKPITDPQECYRVVKEEDLQKNNLVWLGMAPFNNTYVLMMRKPDAERLGVKSLSDLAAYVNEHPNEVRFATDAEFFARPDGYPALEKLYGFKFPPDKVIKLDPGLVYKALSEKQVDVAMGFATDARIKALNLVSLEDDKQFFPVYNPAPVVRKPVMEKYPELADLLNPVAAKLTTEAMIALNYAVDVDHKTPDQAAREWLTAEGLTR